MRHTLPQRIRDAREAAGLSQDHLARRLGVTRRTVQRWEHGGTITALDLARVAAVTFRSGGYFLDHLPELD